jgi:uncharacterized protein YcfJ
MKKTMLNLSLISALSISSAVVLAGDRYDDHDYYNKSGHYSHYDKKHRSYDYGRYDDHRYKDNHGYNQKHVKARVVDVDPIYHRVKVRTPHQECWDEPRRYRNSHSQTSTIAGAIIGGVIGNQFGSGSGNTAMTVAGTLLGGSIGRDIRDNDRHYSGYQEQCRVTHDTHYERQLKGYDVTYKYNGQRYTTFMRERPGKYIPVQVTVKPSYRY